KRPPARFKKNAARAGCCFLPPPASVGTLGRSKRKAFARPVCARGESCVMRARQAVAVDNSKLRDANAQRIWRSIRRSRFFYAMFAIPLLYFIVFHYIPMFGILIAFKDYSVFKGIWGSEWVGLEYFRDFLSDSYFYKLIRNTLMIGLYQI